MFVPPARLTALVLLGIKDRETFPLIFYRENCADMAVDETDIDESFIASGRALAITGTHFSTPACMPPAARRLPLRASMACVPCWISTTAPCCGDSPGAAMAKRALLPMKV
jgi:sugar/nucleoside kinase (ribokinase family)